MGEKIKEIQEPNIELHYMQVADVYSKAISAIQDAIINKKVEVQAGLVAIEELNNKMKHYQSLSIEAHWQRRSEENKKLQEG